MARWVTCSCCGKAHLNTPEDNCLFDSPGTVDAGFGHCTECYGSNGSEGGTFEDIKNAEATGGAEAVEKLVGWAMWNFYNARFKILSDALNAENSANFEALPIWRKMMLIENAVKDGVMI